MSAEMEQQLTVAENYAIQCRLLARQTEETAMEATIDFMDVALVAGWSWERIGRGLDVSGTAARRYYGRNRRRTHNNVRS